MFNFFNGDRSSSPTAVSLTIFRIRATESYIVEIGTPLGVRKRSDNVREFIKTYDCVDREHAQEVLKDLKRKYNLK